MNALKRCILVLLATGWMVLMTGQANAAVCFAGDQSCGGAGSFDGSYIDPAEDAKKQCLEAGFTPASECTPLMGKQISGYCPYSSEYVTCCGLEYAYSSCQYPLVQNAPNARCGNKYKCKCDDTKYKYTVKSCKALNPNAVASGSSCVAVDYKDGGMTTDISFTECACDRALFPYTEELCKTKYNAKPYGEVCIGEDKTTKYYPACECDRSVYLKTSDNCTYGGDPLAGFCNQLGMIYYKSCCSCGAYLAGGDENGPFDPNVIKTFSVGADGVNRPDGYDRCPCPKGDRFKITKCKEGYSPDVWKADDKDLPSAASIGNIKGSKCEIDPCEKIVALWLRNSDNYTMFDGTSSFGFKSTASSDDLWKKGALQSGAQETRDEAEIAVVAKDIAVSREYSCDGSVEKAPLGSVKTAMCTSCARYDDQVRLPSGAYDAVSYTAAVGSYETDCRNQYGCYSSDGYRAKDYCYGSSGSSCYAYDDYGNMEYGTCINPDYYASSGYYDSRCRIYGEWRSSLEYRSENVYSEACASSSDGGYGHDCGYINGEYKCGYWGCDSSGYPCYGACGYGCGLDSGSSEYCSAIDNGGTVRTGSCLNPYSCRIYGEFETTSGLCGSGRSPGCSSWTIQDAPYYSYKRKQGVGLACIRQDEIVSAYYLANTLPRDNFVDMMKEACTVPPKITFQGNTFPIQYEPYDSLPSSTTGIKPASFTAKGLDIVFSPATTASEYFVSSSVKRVAGAQRYVKFGRAITLENVKLIASASTAMVEFNKPISWKTTGVLNQSEYNIYYGAFTNQISSGNIKGVSFNVTDKSTSGSPTSTANNINAVGELRIPVQSNKRPFVQLDFTGGELYNVGSTFVYPAYVYYMSNYPTYSGENGDERMPSSKTLGATYNSSVKFSGPTNANAVNAYGNLYAGTNGSSSAVGHTNAAYIARDIDVTLSGNFVWNLFNSSGKSYSLYLSAASSVGAESSSGAFSAKIRWKSSTWRQCTMRDKVSYFYERSKTDWWSKWCSTRNEEQAEYQAVCSVSNTSTVSRFSTSSTLYHYRVSTGHNPWKKCYSGVCGGFDSSCVTSIWCNNKNERVSVLECS